MWYWHEERHADQWKKFKRLKINTNILNTNGKLIFDKSTKISMGKEKMALKKLDIHIQKN